MPNILSKLFGAKNDDLDGENFFLPQIRGLIHVGANTGQERKLYRRNGVKVLWVEPIPEVFKKLQENLAGFKDQRALNYLLTDQDEKEYAFHVSDNEGASSSIFEFAEHKKICPDVNMTQTIRLRSATLPGMLRKEGINQSDYDALVLDTQGSELLILKGAQQILPNFRFIKTEVANFESYKGGCVLEDIEAFMTSQNFVKARSKVFADCGDVGDYLEVVYARKDAAGK